MPKSIYIGTALLVLARQAASLVAGRGGDADRRRRAHNRDSRGPGGWGPLADVKVDRGARVRAGDVVAELSAIELAHRSGARATRRRESLTRSHVYAGVRAEQVASFEAEFSKAKAAARLCNGTIDAREHAREDR